VKLAVILVAALAARAAADDPKAAERYFRAGEKAYKAQNFAAAAGLFESAYKELPLPEIAFSAAQAYRRQYRVDPKPAYVTRAVELYAVYLDKVKTGGRVGVAADSLGEMKRELDRLGTSAAPVPQPVVVEERTQLGINPELEGEAGARGMSEVGDLPDAGSAKIVTTIDGKPVAPYELVDVTPGPHQIHVEAEGYLPADRTERAIKGAQSLVDVKLSPKPAKVTVKVAGGARVRIDGRAAGTAPGTFEVAAGKHVVTISRSGRVPVAREVTLGRGQEIAIAEQLEATSRRRAVPWVLGVGGGLAVVSITTGLTGLVFDGRASDTLHRIDTVGDATGGDRATYDRQVRNRDRFVTAAWITGGAALVAGGIAAALYFGDDPSDERARIVPVAPGGGAGAAVVGRF